MEEISQHAIEQYKISKETTRTPIVLDQKQLILFAELIARDEPSTAFETRLGLSRVDVEIQKEKTGIKDSDTAKNFLSAIAEDPNEILLKDAENKKNVDKETIVRYEQEEEKIDASKPYDVKVMQDRLQKAEERKAVESHFRVKGEKQEAQFKLDARLGVNFLMDKYGATRGEILEELRRLSVPVESLRR